MPWLSFSDILPEEVRNELQNVVTQIKGLWTSEHNDDGSHGDLTADSVAIAGANIGEWVDLSFSPTRFYTDSGTVSWTVAAAGQKLLKYCRTGRHVTVMYDITGTLATSAADKASALIISLPELYIQPYNSKGDRLDFTYVNLSTAQNATNGSFPTKTWVTTFLTHGTAGLYIERFNNVVFTGGVNYGNYPNESTHVMGQVVFECSPDNNPVSYVHP